MSTCRREYWPQWALVVAAVLMAIILAGVVALVTKPQPDACAGLPRASQADIARANQYERVTTPGPGDITCVLNRGKWREEQK